MKITLGLGIGLGTGAGGDTGLLLDKSFDDGDPPWTFGGPWSIAGGQADCAAVGVGNLRQNTNGSLQVGETYEILIWATAAGTIRVGLGDNNANTTSVDLVVGLNKVLLVAGDTAPDTFTIRIASAGSFVGAITAVDLVKVPTTLEITAMPVVDTGVDPNTLSITYTGAGTVHWMVDNTTSYANIAAAEAALGSAEVSGSFAHDAADPEMDTSGGTPDDYRLHVWGDQGSVWSQDYTIASSRVFEDPPIVTALIIDTSETTSLSSASFSPDSASDYVLIVLHFAHDVPGNAALPSSLTVGGVSIGAAVVSQVNALESSAVYAMKASNMQSGVVAVTFADTVRACMAYAVEYAGVDQTTPAPTTNSDTHWGDPDPTITTAHDGSAFFSVGTQKCKGTTHLPASATSGSLLYAAETGTTNNNDVVGSAVSEIIATAGAEATTHDYSGSSNSSTWLSLEIKKADE